MSFEPIWLPREHGDIIKRGGNLFFRVGEIFLPISTRRMSQIVLLNRVIEQNDPDEAARQRVDATRIVIENLLQPNMTEELTRAQDFVLHSACMRALTQNNEPEIAPTIKSGRALYEQLTQRFSDLSPFGPFLYKSPDRWYVFPPSLRAEVDKVLAYGIHYVDHKVGIGGVVHLASPWHAAIFGMLIQERWGGLPRPLFRGEAKLHSSLPPSLERPHVNRRTARRAVNAFSQFVRENHTNLQLSDEQLNGAAQHYELPTRFIDVTADPAVAARFARRGARAPRSQIGRIYVLPLEDAEAHGLKVILAPPFVKRLYLQRGAFIEPRMGMTAIPTDAIYELRFHVAHPFDVLRDGKRVVLTRKDRFLYRVARWAEQWGEGIDEIPTETTEREDFFQRIVAGRQISVPRRLTEEADATVAELFFYLTTFLNGDRMEVNARLVDGIVRSNPSIGLDLQRRFSDLFVVNQEERPSVFNELKASLDASIAAIA